MTRTDSVPTDQQPGAILAEKYRLLRPIGEGGMSTVWVAMNSVLAIQVAVKFIKTELGERGPQRLLNEAKTAARLRHPSILEIHDYGQADDGSPFVVMEHLEGKTLGELLVEQGRLNAVEAVELLLPIADALSYAHAQGVVHRDVKPDNVFIAQTLAGIRPKMLDFGIAKSSVDDRRLTCRGEVLGSPEYMSPEQARGDEVDHRSDIWSFCAMLYESITGKLPFSARNYNATIVAILQQEVVPTTELGAGDAALWSLLEKGLAKQLSERYSSMHDLGRDLAAWLLSHGTSQDVCHTSLRARWLRDSVHDFEPIYNSSPSVLPLTRSLHVQPRTIRRRRIRKRDVVAWTMPLVALLVGMDWSPARSSSAAAASESLREAAAAVVPLPTSSRAAVSADSDTSRAAPAPTVAVEQYSRKARAPEARSPRKRAQRMRRLPRVTWPLSASTASGPPQRGALKTPLLSSPTRTRARSTLKNPYD